MTRMLTAVMSGVRALLNATVHVKSDQVEVKRKELWSPGKASYI